MTPLQLENLQWMEELGINVKKHTYDTCVNILIGKYIEACDALELTEEQNFKRERQRLLKPTS